LRDRPVAKQTPEEREKGCGEPLEVHGGGGEEGLDAHVVDAAPDGAREPVPGLRLAVIALGPPAMTVIVIFPWFGGGFC
jgi:hypothetical protein